MRDTAKALKWIICILRKRRISFQIFGGLAARAYGAKRELADIDIAVPSGRFSEIVPGIRRYITDGPRRYRDRNWDLLLVTLRYAGQEIDIVGDPIQIYDSRARKWRKHAANFTRPTYCKLYDQTVPVVPKRSLISWKRMLGRRVDIADIRAFTGR